MLPSFWLGRGKKSANSYKPSVCLLEDRTVPSGFASFWSWGHLVTPGPATHLAVEAPHNVKVGQLFSVEVEALDVNNHLATGYVGTVQITLGTTDANAVLPANYKFTAADHGIHWFNVTLAVTGSQTIDATDTVTNSIAGSAPTKVNPTPAATHFVVISPGYVTAGVPVTVTVIALDKYNHVATGYTGTASFTNSDPNAAALSNHTFVAGDHGEYTFQVTFPDTGVQTLTATDTVASSITGHTSPTVEAVNSVTHFGLFSFGVAFPGVPTPVMIVALDANNHVVAGYTGTVKFTISDGAATPPGNYTFLASDNGRHFISVTFNTVGTQSLTATDTVTPSITDSISFHVKKFGWGWGW
jgi:hypothetical protein